MGTAIVDIKNVKFDDTPAAVSGIVPTGAVKLDPQTEEEAMADKFFRVLRETPRGLAEVGANVLSSLVAAPVAAIAGLAAQEYTGDVEKGRKVREDVGRAITWDPNNPEIAKYTTGVGKDLSRRLGGVLSIPAEIGKEVVNLPLESWKVPERPAEIARTAAEFGAYGAIKPGLRVAGKMVRENIATAAVKGAKEAAKPKETVIKPVGEVKFDEPAALTGDTGVLPIGEVAFDGKAAAPATPYDVNIEAAASKYGVDADLVKSVIKAESNGNPEAVSPVGAQGLMQLMPNTAKWMGVKDSFDPAQNIEGGTKYLGYLLKKYGGDESKALAAWNFGEGNIAKGKPLPKETRDFVAKVQSGKGEAITGEKQTTVRPSEHEIVEPEPTSSFEPEKPVTPESPVVNESLTTETPVKARKRGLNEIGDPMWRDSVEDVIMSDMLADLRQGKNYGVRDDWDTSTGEGFSNNVYIGSDNPSWLEGVMKASKANKDEVTNVIRRMLARDELTPKQEKIARRIDDVIRQQKASDYYRSIESDLNKYNEQSAAVKAEGGGVSIRNAFTDAERAERGEAPIERPVLERSSEWREEVKADVDDGLIDPRKLADEINASVERGEAPANLNDRGNYAMLYDKVRLSNEHKAIQRKIEDVKAQGGDTRKLLLRRDEIEAFYDANEKATTATGTEQGRALQSRQEIMAEDYSPLAMLRQAKQDGVKITDEVRAKYEKMSAEIEAANKKIAEYEAKAGERAAKVAVAKLQNEVAKEQRKARRTVAKENLDAEFKDLGKQLNDLLGGQLNSGIDPIGVIILGKMAKNRVHSGIITVEGLVDSIYTEVKNLGLDISKRDIMDAISGYGVTSKMSQDAVNVKLRELKRQMRLISALEDAQAKKPPLRSGLQRDEVSDVVREMQRQVKQAMRESGIDSGTAKTPEQQWKTSLDAVKTRLKNSIYDIEKQLITGEKTPKKPGIKYDDEANVLKELRDGLKNILVEVEGKPEMSPEQRVRIAEATVEKSIANWEKKIAEFDPNAPETPKQPSKTPLTPELTAKREFRDKLRKDFQQMKKDAQPKKDPEEAALHAFKLRVERQIKELERKVAEGDFSVKERKEVKTSPEKLSLLYDLDKAKRKYYEAVFKDRMAHRTGLQKVGTGLAEMSVVPRAIKSSFDLSALFRQGAFYTLGDPLLAAKTFPDMFKALRSQKGMFETEQALRERPNYHLYHRSGLELTEHGAVTRSKMEEAYQSRLAEKIPGVAASGRAYQATLNRLRADVFDSEVGKLNKSGEPATMEEMKAIANAINVGTGRGPTIGKSAAALSTMTSVFFAPRLMISRFQLTSGQPLYGGTARTRALVAKRYARALIGLGVIYTMGNALGGDVEIDPRSSDFGKVKFGNTRVDPLAGMSQTIALIAKLTTGQVKKQGGQIVDITGADIPYGATSAWDVLTTFLRSKLAPLPSAGMNIVQGKNVVGEPTTVSSSVYDLIGPLAPKDIYESLREQGVPSGSALGMLAIFGMGIQNYAEKHGRNRQGRRSISRGRTRQ